jgi:FkbM family methyltransferase
MTLDRKIELMISSFKMHAKLLGFLPAVKFFIDKHLVRKKELKIYVKERRYPIYLRNFSSDITIFGQLFINEDYKAGIELLNPKVIIDCGANIGLSALYFTYRFPDAKIYAIEPELSNYNVLQKNIFGYSNIETYRKAIWDETTDLEIIMHTSHDSFSVKASTDHSQIEVVHGISINDFLVQHDIASIDLLKIDIEGAELPLFSRNLNWLDKTKTIILEIHERFNPGSTAFINDLLGNNFTISYTGEYVKYNRKP